MSLPTPTASGAALITGASAGIGAAIAGELAARGHNLVLVARRKERLDEIALELAGAHGVRADALGCDLAKSASRQRLPGRVKALGLDIEVLVNNAAVPKRRSASALTAEEVQQTMTVNFESPVRITLAVLPRMLERDAGVIVNVSSFGGRVGILGEAAYCASKFAVRGWSESLALDLWHTGVDVRLILPGAIDTEIWEQPGNDEPLYDGELEPPETVARGIIDAIEGDRFEHYLPDMAALAEYKTSHIDEFMAGAMEFAAHRLDS